MEQERPEPEWKDKFDVAVGCGVFLKNHVPHSGFEELVDALKNGGLAIFLVRLMNGLS